MFKLTIKSNGKTYTDIKKGVEALVASGIEKSLQQKLSHLQSEMTKENVEITVDMQNGKISIHNASDSLKEKIIAVLNP